MAGKDYQCSIQAPVPATEAFDKISRVSEWWAKGFEGRTEEPGDAFTVRFGKTFIDFKVVEAVPGGRAVWDVTDCYIEPLKDKTEWSGTSVVWEISSSDGTTTVAMTHHGIVPGVECYGMCEQGWNLYVGKSLLQLLAEGKGIPNDK